ncbi:MAG: hypothetical protein B6D77_17285 [gamma proteobacterium symbiont of Ctena orbiculata]|nr:MAG: hypothetical protein B6D77_17285 [gamma proteobacterium symbiont of Ctena orbiculata]PVV24813.1 MAG: hypothetical protein B6D78_01080 [gamma proteobacterium symbiont of Ctena orbiculata]
MGRLFWKFFLFLFLSQILTVFGVSIVIMLTKPEPGNNPLDLPINPPPFDQPPPGLIANMPFAMPGPPPHRQYENEQVPIHPEMRGPDQPPPGPRSTPPPTGPNHSLSPSVLPLLAGSLVSLVIATLLALYFSRPIRSLREAFELVANGRLGTRIGEAMGGRHDELSDLAYGFDSMAKRLQSLVEGQQSLLHDVSHELRSPLARLQAALDLMQQQPDRAVEFIERIERESNRMDRLIEELLTLARLDAGLPGNSEIETDLGELIDTIVEDATFEAKSKQCTVKAIKAENLYVSCNPNLIHRAIENIMRNAIRHTPSGTQVTISCDTNPETKRLSLSIRDQGSGMPESELKSVFEPFFRGETAGRFNGYGLGMAITKRIVTAHRGEVRAENLKDGGFLVTIELPMLE